MADQIYYSLFTKQGLALLTEAIQNGTKLGITSMAFGDGNGTLPIPNDSFSKLVHEVYRTPLNSLAPDPNNSNWLRAEAVIASAIGGFNIRELGLYAGDVLIAYSNYPATYKPNPSDGTARIMTFRMVLQIDNTASFELKIDPDVVLATITAVNEVKVELYKNTVNSVNTIEDLLKLDVWNGRTVDVKGYLNPTDLTLAQPYVGGDKFTYDAAFATVNNGITIFNGWKRDLSDQYLSTHDAGLIEDGKNHSDQLQALLNLLEDDMTLGIFGTHLVNTNMLVSAKHNIKVKFAEDAVLSAKELRDQFIFKGYNGALNGAGARGILHFHQCNNPRVVKPIIRGCQKHNLNAEEPFEDGDAGVGFSMCMNPLVEYGDISHTTTWGIIAERCTNAIAQYNKVSNVLRQSGISLTINEGNSGKALYNVISDAALYGIEWETYADSSGNQSTGNIITNCQKGEAVVGNICELDSSLNQYINCSQGMNSEVSNVVNTKLIKYHNNTCLNTTRAVVLSNVGNVNVVNNLIEKNSSYPNYFITSAYDTVLEVTSSTTFIALGRSGLAIGAVIRINGIEYTISNVEIIPDTKYGSDTLKQVTVSTALSDVRDMTQIYTKPSTANLNAFFTAGTNKNVLMSGNIGKGYAVCFKTDVEAQETVEINERLSGNTFINCDAYLQMNGKNYGFRERENILINVGDNIGTYITPLAKTVFTERGLLEVYRKNPSDNLKTTKNYYLSQSSTIIRAIITFPNADATTTGTVVLQLDGGQNIATIPASAFNKTYNVVDFLYHLKKGNHTFLLTDTVGDLSYKEAVIQLIYA